MAPESFTDRNLQWYKATSRGAGNVGQMHNKPQIIISCRPIARGAVPVGSPECSLSRNDQPSSHDSAPIGHSWPHLLSDAGGRHPPGRRARPFPVPLLLPACREAEGLPTKHRRPNIPPGAEFAEHNSNGPRRSQSYLILFRERSRPATPHCQASVRRRPVTAPIPGRRTSRPQPPVVSSSSQ